MDEEAVEKPITDYHVITLQSLWPHLEDAAKIAQSLEQWPKIIEDTIPALNAAQRYPSLPDSPTPFDPAPSACYQSRIESLHSFFPRAELWVRSRYTRSQLDTVRKAFMEAFDHLDSRCRAKDARQFQTEHAKRLARQILNRKLDKRRN